MVPKRPKRPATEAARAEALNRRRPTSLVTAAGDLRARSRPRGVDPRRARRTARFSRRDTGEITATLPLGKVPSGLTAGMLALALTVGSARRLARRRRSFGPRCRPIRASFRKRFSAFSRPRPGRWKISWRARQTFETARFGARCVQRCRRCHCRGCRRVGTGEIVGPGTDAPCRSIAAGVALRPGSTVSVARRQPA
ncbi:hypothetical protein bAD24_p01085 (plasmid) [Burkholderia sp. AD24]|nr:hypothetical protein bAD24_p01085 [Burkholderia sp. AD24]